MFQTVFVIHFIVQLAGRQLVPSFQTMILLHTVLFTSSPLMIIFITFVLRTYYFNLFKKTQQVIKASLCFTLILITTIITWHINVCISILYTFNSFIPRNNSEVEFNYLHLQMRKLFHRILYQTITGLELNVSPMQISSNFQMFLITLSIYIFHFCLLLKNHHTCRFTIYSHIRSLLTTTTCMLI